MKGDYHDGIVTHGRSREFRMHMKNPAQTGNGCIRFNDINFHQATFAGYSGPIRLRVPGRYIYIQLDWEQVFTTY